MNITFFFRNTTFVFYISPSCQRVNIIMDCSQSGNADHTVETDGSVNAAKDEDKEKHDGK